MGHWQLRTPVVFAVFNRLDTAKRTFEVIRQVKPPKLFVLADSPRENRPDDVENCNAVRALIDQVDWNCEVIKRYPPTNLGCTNGVSSGLEWVFSMVEEAIVIEHDCLAHPSFFRFCDELLERYRDDERIMSITGQNAQFGRKRTEYSYYFSQYPLIWGWALWRRSWQYYDVKMTLWPHVKERGLLKEIFPDPRAAQCWEYRLEETYAGRIDTFDYQWNLACWLQSGLTITPSVNLVSNIGFTGSSINNTNPNDLYANVPVEAMEFPLMHPPFVIRNREADEFTQNTAFSPSFLTKAHAKLNRTLGKRYI